MTLFNEPPQVLKTHLHYQSRKFSFQAQQLRLPNGAEGEWSYIEHPGGALAVPVTPSGELVLVRQYRFAMAGRVLEFPAGTLEPGEDPAMTIARELEEETGYRAHRWQKLGEFCLCPGYSSEMIYAFLATDLTPLENPPARDPDEDMEVVVMSPQALMDAIRQGLAIDAKSISSFLLAQIFLMKESIA